jgi:membrane protein DedA with SNARE-associated domain
VIGALALYRLGYALGEDRLRRWLDRIHTVDGADLDKADRWFERHEKSTVLFGRCVPVVRSLVSIPAGANHMRLGRFTGLTALGSLVWNSLFIGAGYGLGSRWEQVEAYSHWLDYAVGALLAGAVLGWIVKKRRRAAAPGSGRAS